MNFGCTEFCETFQCHLAPLQFVILAESPLNVSSVLIFNPASISSFFMTDILTFPSRKRTGVINNVINDMHH